MMGNPCFTVRVPIGLFKAQSSPFGMSLDHFNNSDWKYTHDNFKISINPM
uniref:Uncharacterized protein n=1 Tax=Picea sitchensis TaxID=3332 RepID=D5A9N5_PICSI|nr:unknown [Picea sitchensis]